MIDLRAFPRGKKNRIMYKPPRPEDFSVTLSLSDSLSLFSFLFRSVCRETRSALRGQGAAVQLSRGLLGKERVVPSSFAVRRGEKKYNIYINFTRKIFVFRSRLAKSPRSTYTKYRPLVTRKYIRILYNIMVVYRPYCGAIAKIFTSISR